jgi:hypothetical protein
LDKDVAMEKAENKISPHHIISRLIDLVIQLPEHEQLALLERLKRRQRFQDNQINSMEIEPHSKTPRYASGNYIYWDLFG